MSLTLRQFISNPRLRGPCPVAAAPLPPRRALQILTFLPFLNLLFLSIARAFVLRSQDRLSPEVRSSVRLSLSPCGRETLPFVDILVLVIRPDSPKCSTQRLPPQEASTRTTSLPSILKVGGIFPMTPEILRCLALFANLDW